MSEKFDGSVPDINIRSLTGAYFSYYCGETNKELITCCTTFSPMSEKCFDCIGFNRKFAKYYKDNNRCSCGFKVDYGYFILIFHFDMAGLLPKDFKIMCCNCHDKQNKPECNECDIVDGT